MNPFALQVASGKVFFVGMAMAITASVFRYWVKQRILKLSVMILWLLGISFVLLSANPLPIWSYAVWIGLCVAVSIAFNRHFTSKAKIGAVAVFVLFSLGMCILELPYHLPRSVAVSPKQTVYVIGDSISAGIHGKELLWPGILGDLSHLKVVNLAQPGATLTSALTQANRAAEPSSLVILEIGGNDLLGGANSESFRTELDDLLGKLDGRSMKVIMFELPLPPFHNGFGKAQRLLAKKHGVTLIPKSCLASVFGLKGATIDGLHLSQMGHDALAKSVFRLLKVEDKK